MSILDKFSLAGQVAVVTGASRGIGRGIALCLAEAGADVVLAARNEKLLGEVAKEVEARGRRALVFTGDFMKEEASAQLAETTVKQFGKLDCWVNNVGGQPDNKQRPFMDTNVQYFDDMIDLNLKSFWAGTLHAAKHMPDGGNIISITSRSALLGIRTNHALYASMKATMNHLTATLGGELGPKIRVNAVAPGPVLTDTLTGVMETDAESLLAKEGQMGIPMGRIGRPDDVGSVVVFLASPAASWITGHCIYVTGGLY